GVSLLHQIARVGVHRDRLAGDALARAGAQVERHVGDVLLRDGRAQARRLEELLAERRLAHAERFRLRRDDPLDALALDDAGLDAVDAHLVRAGLDGDALREADHRPLRRGVRAALREAVL